MEVAKEMGDEQEEDNQVKRGEESGGGGAKRWRKVRMKGKEWLKVQAKEKGSSQRSWTERRTLEDEDKR